MPTKVIRREIFYNTCLEFGMPTKVIRREIFYNILP
jgi:hypothetical protein